MPGRLALQCQRQCRAGGWDNAAEDPLNERDPRQDLQATIALILFLSSSAFASSSSSPPSCTMAEASMCSHSTSSSPKWTTTFFLQRRTLRMRPSPNLKQRLKSGGVGSAPGAFRWSSGSSSTAGFFDARGKDLEDQCRDLSLASFHSNESGIERGAGCQL
eukprot:s761_g6.t1